MPKIAAKIARKAPTIALIVYKAPTKVATIKAKYKAKDSSIRLNKALASYSLSKKVTKIKELSTIAKRRAATITSIKKPYYYKPSSKLLYLIIIYIINTNRYNVFHKRAPTPSERPPPNQRTTCAQLSRNVSTTTKLKEIY